ncbi:putative transcription factor MYB-HB-like family [Helianthus anomalus]
MKDGVGDAVMVEKKMNKASSKEAGEGLDEPILESGGEERGKVNGSWSPEEYVILSDLVSKFGAKNWSLIARGIPERTGKSRRLRWLISWTLPLCANLSLVIARFSYFY